MTFIAGFFLIFSIIFAVNVESDSHLKKPCQVSNFEELTYFDPTLPEPDRWSPRNILIQLAHPTKETCPTTWFRWETHPINIWKWHDEFKSFTNKPLPIIDPPIVLSDGTRATNLSQLEQVRTR